MINIGSNLLSPIHPKSFQIGHFILGPIVNGDFFVSSPLSSPFFRPHTLLFPLFPIRPSGTPLSLLKSKALFGKLLGVEPSYKTVFRDCTPTFLYLSKFVFCVLPTPHPTITSLSILLSPGSSEANFFVLLTLTGCFLPIPSLSFLFGGPYHSQENQKGYGTYVYMF